MVKEDILIKIPTIDETAIMKFKDENAWTTSLSLRCRWKQYEPMNCTPAELRVVEGPPSFSDDDFKLERPNA